VTSRNEYKNHCSFSQLYFKRNLLKFNVKSDPDIHFLHQAHRLDIKTDTMEISFCVRDFVCHELFMMPASKIITLIAADIVRNLSHYRKIYIAMDKIFHSFTIRTYLL
jgi:hypothetical protein